MMAGAAVFAVLAQHRRLDRDLGAGLEILDSLTRFNDFAGGLVAQYARITAHPAGDAALAEVVHVAATDSCRPQPHQNLSLTRVRRIGNRPHFEAVLRDQL